MRAFDELDRRRGAAYPGPPPDPAAALLRLRRLLRRGSGRRVGGRARRRGRRRRAGAAARGPVGPVAAGRRPARPGRGRRPRAARPRLGVRRRGARARDPLLVRPAGACAPTPGSGWSCTLRRRDRRAAGRRDAARASARAARTTSRSPRPSTAPCAAPPTARTCRDARGRPRAARGARSAATPCCAGARCGCWPPSTTTAARDGAARRPGRVARARRARPRRVPLRPPAVGGRRLPRGAGWSCSPTAAACSRGGDVGPFSPYLPSGAYL